MKGHSPYIREDDTDDLDNRPSESIYARFVAGCVALPMIDANLRWSSYVRHDKFKKLKNRCSVDFIESKFEAVETVAHASLEQSLKGHPDLATFFSDSQRDAVASDLVEV